MFCWRSAINDAMAVGGGGIHATAGSGMSGDGSFSPSLTDGHFRVIDLD